MAAEGRSPRFSPDGRWIAFWRGTLEGSLPNGRAFGALFLVSSAGGSPKRIGADLPWTGYPIWSPDSKSLMAFAQGPSQARDEEWRTNTDWRVIPLDGGPSIRTEIVPFLSRSGFASSIANGIPRPIHWTPKSIFFVADHGDSTNVWELEFTFPLRLIRHLKQSLLVPVPISIRQSHRMVRCTSPA